MTSQRVEILGAGNKYAASDLLSASNDPAKLHPMASLGEQLDYLVLDDDRQATFPVQVLPYPQGDGAMICATAQVLCILAVCHPCFSRSILFSTILSMSNRTCPNFTLSVGICTGRAARTGLRPGWARPRPRAEISLPEHHPCPCLGLSGFFLTHG